MSLQAIDEEDNTTVMPLTVEAYVLIPQIESVTATGVLLGAVSESVENTPVHFFRVRSGEGPLLLSSGATLTDSRGRFASASFFRSSETITLTSSGGIGSVTEK